MFTWLSFGSALPLKSGSVLGRRQHVTPHCGTRFARLVTVAQFNRGVKGAWRIVLQLDCSNAPPKKSLPTAVTMNPFTISAVPFLCLENQAATSCADKLIQFGLDPYPVKTLDDAADSWSRLAGQIGLAIVDVDLPGSSPGPMDGGLQFAELIDRWSTAHPTAHRPELLVLTNHSDNAQLLHRAMRAGVDVCLAKEPSEGSERERNEPYRIENFASALLLRAMLRSRALHHELEKLRKEGFHEASTFRRLTALCARIFSLSLGRRPWFALAQGAHGPAFLAGAGSVSLPEEHGAYGRFVDGRPLPNNSNDTVTEVLGTASTIEILSEGARLVLGLLPVPPTSAFGPEPMPLHITELIRKYAAPELGVLGAHVAPPLFSTTKAWSCSGSATELQHEELMLQLIAAADRSAVPYYQTKFPTASARERIRVRHGSLCSAHLIEISGKYALLLCPEAYVPDPQLIAAAEGLQAARLVSGAVRLAPGDVATVIMDRSLQKIETLSFARSEGDSILSIDSRDVQKMFVTSFLEVARRAEQQRYFAKFDGISPQSAAKNLRFQSRCFLGISLENEKFDREEMLTATLAWIDSMFSECCVVIGDAIHRHTLRLRDASLSEDQALSRAIAIGKQFTDNTSRAFSANSTKCKYEIVRMSDSFGSEEWAERTRVLRSLTETVPSYAYEVCRFAKEFVQRQDESKRSQRDDELAREYLLEEAAFCGIMSDAGWPVLVYPGPIDPFKAISDGKIPDAPECLKKLQFVSLKLRTR